MVFAKRASYFMIFLMSLGAVSAQADPIVDLLRKEAQIQESLKFIGLLKTKVDSFASQESVQALLTGEKRESWHVALKFIEHYIDECGHFYADQISSESLLHQDLFPVLTQLSADATSLFKKIGSISEQSEQSEQKGTANPEPSLTECAFRVFKNPSTSLNALRQAYLSRLDQVHLELAVILDQSSQEGSAANGEKKPPSLPRKQRDRIEAILIVTHATQVLSELKGRVSELERELASRSLEHKQELAPAPVEITQGEEKAEEKAEEKTEEESLLLVDYTSLHGEEARQIIKPYVFSLEFFKIKLETPTGLTVEINRTGSCDRVSFPCSSTRYTGFELLISFLSTKGETQITRKGRLLVEGTTFSDALKNTKIWQKQVRIILDNAQPIREAMVVPTPPQPPVVSTSIHFPELHGQMAPSSERPNLSLEHGPLEHKHGLVGFQK